MFKRKNLTWMLAAILIICSPVLTSCGDNAGERILRQ